jgi:hypothetical protein
VTRALLLVLTACGRIGFDPLGPRAALVLADPGEQLVDFPLLVVLDDTRADRALLAPDASDLRFYDSANTLLVHEIEQVGAPGGPPLVAWVRVPVIVGATTTLVAKYGSANPPPPASGSVWSDAYAGVWHFTDVGDPLDATLAHHDGVSLGAIATPGMIAGGRAFADATPPQAISIADAPDLDFTAMTVSGWLFQRSTPVDPFTAVVTRQRTASDQDDFYLGEMGGAAYAEVDTPPAPIMGYVVTGTTPPLAQWTHVAFASDATTIHLYMDATDMGSVAVSGTIDHSATPIYFGADHNSSIAGTGPNDDRLDAILDEVRIERVARSPAWIAYDVASMRDSVITYGPTR